MSGEIIQFEIPEALKGLYKLSNLRSEYSEYLENIDIENMDIELGRIIFFNDNMEKLDMDDLVISENTYHVLISDNIVRLTFDRTIRLIHDYSSLPKNFHLQIENLNWNAYHYMYNEINFICSDDFLGGIPFGINLQDEDDIKEKFRVVLEKYNLQPLENFLNLEENDKINIIIAYLRECYVLNINIDSYNFIDI